MIRNEEIATYLRCVLEELNGSVRRDLRSDYSKKTVDSLVLVLRRLMTQLEAGDAIADKQLLEWTSLERNLDRLVGTRAAPVDDVEAAASHQPTPLAQLDSQVSRVQARLADPQTFARLVDALRADDDSAKAWLRASRYSISAIVTREKSVSPCVPPPSASGAVVTGPAR